MCGVHETVKSVTCKTPPIDGACSLTASAPLRSCKCVAMPDTNPNAEYLHTHQQATRGERPARVRVARALRPAPVSLRALQPPVNCPMPLSTHASLWQMSTICVQLLLGTKPYNTVDPARWLCRPLPTPSLGPQLAAAAAPVCPPCTATAAEGCGSGMGCRSHSLPRGAPWRARSRLSVTPATTCRTHV